MVEVILTRYSSFSRFNRWTSYSNERASWPNLFSVMEILARNSSFSLTIWRYLSSLMLISFALRFNSELHRSISWLYRATLDSYSTIFLPSSYILLLLVSFYLRKIYVLLNSYSYSFRRLSYSSIWFTF